MSGFVLTQEWLREHFRYEDGELYIKKKWDGAGLRNKLGRKVGSLNKNGYVYFSLKKKRYLLHRVVFFLHNGYFPKIVDHKNGVRSDNRIENLREADASKNQMNRKVSYGKRFGIKGVYDARGKFNASIHLNGKKVHLGNFETKEEAKAAYDKAALEHFGEFARFG